MLTAANIDGNVFSRRQSQVNIQIFSQATGPCNGYGGAMSAYTKQQGAAQNRHAREHNLNCYSNCSCGMSCDLIQIQRAGHHRNRSWPYKGLLISTGVNHQEETTSSNDTVFKMGNKKKGYNHGGCNPYLVLAGPTRLELATSGVTGRHSNQLNYDPSSDA